MTTRALLNVEDLKVHFLLPRKGLFGERPQVHAVDGVSFDIAPGETLSLVGESGCGKTTIGRSIVRLTKATAGTIRLDGMRIDNLAGQALRESRRKMQFIFQDPFSSLNPRMRVRDILAEPLVNYGMAKDAAALDKHLRWLVDVVRLPVDALGRWPHEFSGGQRQRIGIARALALKPELLICDEAVSALDVSVKAQIVNLLMDLQKELKIAMLFISHDLAIVEHMTHRVAVLYLGRMMEIGTREQLFSQPRHPYTKALLSAVPDVEKLARPQALKGDVPSPIKPPSGCRFHTRCPIAADRCRIEPPVLRPAGAGQMVACHFADSPSA